MIYSVWNADARRYDYFQDEKPVPDTPQPHHLRGGGELGVASTRAAWPLPNDAAPAGFGPEPKGALASLGGVGSVGGNLGSIAIFGGAVYVAWRYLFKKKRA